MNYRTVTFASGDTRQVPTALGYPVLGLDEDDRVVVQMGSLQAPPVYTISLTSCCATFERSIGADAMVCRECRNPVPADVYDRPVVDPYFGPGPETADADQRVWIWFGVHEGMPDTVLMVFIHDVEGGGLPALRMLLALDRDTADSFGIHAQNAANALGLRAELREFQLVRLVEALEPTAKQE